MRFTAPRVRGGMRSLRWAAWLAFGLQSVEWLPSGMPKAGVMAMPKGQMDWLREESVRMFHHGFDNYMELAFPADELRPVSCTPHRRDLADPSHIGVNDVLGQFALTAIDSLSSLAIMAHTSEKSRLAFWDTVEKLEKYFLRTGGFDIDSTIQVFETNIRVLGGLLSAHLYAIGEFEGVGEPPRGSYDGVLLRLAYDLGERLLPAFETSETGIPHPRVNLRYGLRKRAYFQTKPFTYTAEGRNWNETAFMKPFAAPRGSKPTFTEPEINPAEDIVENCAAGAGSLVLEMTVLSRLTGDGRFEEVAKKAFHSVYIRRSHLDLIGGGIDSETGEWTELFSGIGAGIDSFFEYAFKSHILLSVDGQTNSTAAQTFDSEYFKTAFDILMAAIDKHLKTKVPFTYYQNAHLMTGAVFTNWIDSLGAYFIGLLANSGAVEDAIKLGLLFTALWTKYGALPERWNFRDFNVEGGLGWWPGRPELAESTYTLYQVTKDPWYLYVGDMIIKDMTARCKTICGWAGLQNVETGEKSDRMESFILSETAKYLYLLYDTDHPLQKDDRAWVFSTEGHPLIIPKKYAKSSHESATPIWKLGKTRRSQLGLCPFASKDSNGIFSQTASRGDIYHAFDFAEVGSRRPGLNIMPRTLPRYLIPPNAQCERSGNRRTFQLVFPNFDTSVYEYSSPNLTRVQGGLLLQSLSNVRVWVQQHSTQYRVMSVEEVALGNDERIYLSRDALSVITDAAFSVRWNPYVLKIEFKQAEKTTKSPSWGSSDNNWEDLRQLLHSSLSQLLKPPPNLPPAPTFPTGISASNLLSSVVAPNSRVPDDGESYLYFYSVSHPACEEKITMPSGLYEHLQLLLIPRGGCTFTQKLSNIPTTEIPHLKTVLFVDYSLGPDNENDLVRPLLDYKVPYTVGLIGGKNMATLDSVLEIKIWRQKGTLQYDGIDVANWEIV